MTKFTKGVWSISADRNGRMVIKSGPISIADIYVPPSGEFNANAHLIAASPELYEALFLADCYLQGDPTLNGDHVAEKVAAALKKARGES